MNSSDDIGNGLVAFAWAFFSISFLVVGLRVWTRIGYLKDRMQVHDWLMVCAVFFEIFHCAFLQMSREYGMGRHIQTLDGSQISHQGHYNRVDESFSIIPSYFGRMSFAAFLLGVIGSTGKPQKMILWAIIVVDTIINIVVAIQIYAQCGTHLAAKWNPALAAIYSCQDPEVETNLGYAQASLNSLCDLILTVLPITIIRKLNMPTGTKIGLGALLALSFFAFVASVAKAVEIRQLSNGDDFTYNFAVLQYCVVGENNIVMIAASIPMLRALFLKDKSPSGGPSSSYPNPSRAGTRKNATHVTATKLSSAEDEEHMLGDLPKEGITRTVGTVVTTTYTEGHKEPEVSVQQTSNSGDQW